MTLILACFLSFIAGGVIVASIKFPARRNFGLTDDPYPVEDYERLINR